MRKIILVVIISCLIILISLYVKGGNFLGQNLFNTSVLPSFPEKVKVASQESVVIDVVKKVGPSVVTISIKNSESLDAGNPFSIFGIPDEQEDTQPRNIGSGFIVTSDGLVVTNKHVVSDAEASYEVLTSNGKRFAIEKIYRDPTNDIAIVKINISGQNIKPVIMGDSSKIEVGQLAIAIGTALGEFSNTVTTGVISGVGRGIMAGSYFEGSIEQLDDVLQTDAAINPGNSGGPLLNSSGQVVGVNTAVSSNGQNIGFALPINKIKESIENFNNTGQFDRAFLGVSYQLINERAALANDLPQGAYIETLVKDSAAEKAGLKEGDIITQIDNKNLKMGSYEISTIVAKKKIGEKILLKVYQRDDEGNGETKDISIILSAAPSQ